MPTLALAPLAAVVVWGCAGTPELERQPASTPRIQPGTFAPGDTVAGLAIGMVGTPYRYGGADPQHGFDCSGLVFYAYRRAGYTVPRRSEALFKAARKIALRDASAGDLVFFQDQEKLSHVGIYVGDGRFVHAPASGRVVTVEDVDAPYYQQHLVAVGRLLPD